MEYAIIGTVIIAVITAGIVIFLRSKKNTSNMDMSKSEKVPASADIQITSKDKELQEFVVQMEMIPAETIHDESRLAEISDSKVLAHINNLIPGLMQVGNAANNVVKAGQENSEVLYRAIIPAGTKLADSKAMEGAVRGIYHGTDGIKGHANWVAVQAQKGSAIIANTAAAAMGVASMVVGQYYMNQINTELSEISDGISKISDFQDNEYRSRVFSLVSHVKTISDFQVEILENDELRLSKISQLDSLEEECTQLLGQANLTLVGYTKNNDLNYGSYAKKLPEIQNWFIYQKSLLDVLYKISDLKYTLHIGTVSREHCTAILPVYTHQVTETQKQLTKWHQKTTKYLKIDTSEIRRKRDGFDGVLHLIPGWFNDDLNFRAIEKSTARMIKTQTEGHCNAHGYDTSDLYENDVQLIVKAGKLYYLPSDTKKGNQ